jgi:predicted amidohydrolase
MPRPLKVAAAQLGPIARDETRRAVVERLLALLQRAHESSVELVVFPELALTTFFPRWFMADQAEVDVFFETAMPGPETRPLFETAARLGIGFYLGYAEKTVEDGATHRYNSAVLVDRQGRIVGKYRKIHLPGHSEYDAKRPWQHLEKRYFEPGNLGFPVWRALGGIMGMCICNDRRRPARWRTERRRG